MQFIKHTLTQEGYVEYLVKVIAPGNYSFHFKDRYSRMRSFQSMLKKQFNLATFNGLPNFPPKKAFGSKAADFLNSRSLALQQFFNSFLTNKDVLRQADHLIQNYFQEHASDDQSRQKIKEFMDYKENKNKKPA